MIHHLTCRLCRGNHTSGGCLQRRSDILYWGTFYIATISTVLHTSEPRMGVSYIFEKLLAFSLCTIVFRIRTRNNCIQIAILKRIALARGTLTAAYSEQVDTLAQWYVGQWQWLTGFSFWTCLLSLLTNDYVGGFDYTRNLLLIVFHRSIRVLQLVGRSLQICARHFRFRGGGSCSAVVGPGSRQIYLANLSEQSLVMLDRPLFDKSTEL